MKMKSLFVAALVTMALVSCDKENTPRTPAETGKTNFEVTLPGAIATYAVETPQVAGRITPLYNDVTVYLAEPSGNAKAYTWTDEEIKNKSKRFEQILPPSKVVVVVNKGSVTLPESVSTTSLLSELHKIVIADQNKAEANVATEDARSNAAGDYISAQQVTLIGEATNFTDEAADDGHTLKKAAVELKSLVSRFEVGTVKPGAGLKSLTVEAVYVNFFYNEYGKTTQQSFTETSWPANFTPAWATDNGSAEVTSQDGTKVYAYQVFAGDMVPHIIYKVSGELEDNSQLSDGTSGAFTGKYVTVNGFKDGNTALTSIEAHKIYKMGLTDGGIEITPDEITDKPEKDKIDLVVDITVADWTEVTVTPEI